MKQLLFLMLCFHACMAFGQTADLSVSIEPQNLSGTDISQVHIFETFQYVVTISNTGNAVSNSTVSITLNNAVTVTNYSSQNPLNGAALATNFELIDNLLTASLPTMPNNGSVEIKITVTAPETPGGISIMANAQVPAGTIDTNTSNNQSVISLDVTDIVIDFTMVMAQVSPPQPVAISAWGDTVTYQVVITNNSAIEFPITGFNTRMALNTPQSYGIALASVESVTCVANSGGTNCPSFAGWSTDIYSIDSTAEYEVIYQFEGPHTFTAGGQVTVEIVVRFDEPACSLLSNTIQTKHHGLLQLEHSNQSPNESNEVITTLLSADTCETTDPCIQTVQIDPPVGSPIDYGEVVTFETTICNNGPNPANIIAYFQNLSNAIQISILTVNCLNASGPNLTCGALAFANTGSYWTTNTFTMPPNETVTVQTTLIFLEPPCSLDPNPTNATIRSGALLMSPDLIDSNFDNNIFHNYFQLPPPELCETVELTVTKTQIDPAPPQGASVDSPTLWGNITYEITVSNDGENDTYIELIDYLPQETIPYYTATLESVSCVSTTGSAECGSIGLINTGVPLDGVFDDPDTPDVFWKISFEDNWLLPINSSITFHAVVNWQPDCSETAIEVQNAVEVFFEPTFTDATAFNNNASTITYLSPCLDLIVQTFPEFTSVVIGEQFNWIVDISNSVTSSAAVDAYFEDTLDLPFTISGSPSCVVTTGTGTCISSFTVSDNTISGVIPYLEAGSTLRIYIPVVAPNIGGAYINTAEVIPSTNNNEITPDTNLSISSVQVIAPLLSKSFFPESIYENEKTLLSFTVTKTSSISSNVSIAFTDVLPYGLYLTGAPFWVESNGCTGDFIGTAGDPFIGIENLTFPAGVTSCSFAVMVASEMEGDFINDTNNFEDQNSIDTTPAFAALEVLPFVEEVVLCDTIPQGFSPNHDGINDTFNIPCLETFTANSLKVYNRHGALVYQSENYKNTWDGIPNSGLLAQNKVLPVGTYFYVLTLKDNPQYPEPIVGWVYLNY